MAQSVLERAGEQIAESARKASRTTSAVADAIEDGVGAAKRVAKQGCDAAEEFFDDTTKRLQRHPTETVIASFAVGVAAGLLIGWTMRKRELL
jgi:ElaB/YqjD/DUF883 family membrane-anchored ribosome-binding protein